ncbi:hypothetical protein BJ508DRAFT_348848 [Ascobolus immersus RN42]|uniref:Cora-domain-containing protein n=1 Tax=Ascobolus immersus RN42 TaxID=1160509 RepID=A0A3N4I4E2_ASCIM|nr:hypothetical protein BJ508DRAFT_348848 [Ascobolus immersus RN42]
MFAMGRTERFHFLSFVNQLTDCDLNKMRFDELTALPDNVWVVEFTINFVACLTAQEYPKALTLTPGYSPKKQSRFVTTDPTKSTSTLPVITEAAYGFRFVGDLHDKLWTCYKLIDMGNIPASVVIAREKKYMRRLSDNKFTFQSGSQQRKCVEGALVLEGLEMVYDNTETILDIMEQEEDTLDPNAVLTASDLSGENYFSTMNKHSTYYPWVLQCCTVLKAKLAGVDDVVNRWIDAEQSRRFTPRWSVKDQAEHGPAIRRNMEEIKRKRRQLELLARRVQTKIDSVTTLKDSLEAELSLREARTSTQQANSIGLFTVVTVVFLPLSFATSVVSIDLGWTNPVRSLMLIMFPTTIGTILFLLNLPVFYHYYSEATGLLQEWLRQKMLDDASPFAFWKSKAKTLKEAENRTRLLMDDQIHQSESNWWYWHFFLVFVLVSLPVKQLQFAFKLVRGRPVGGDYDGILKKLLCLLLTPLWILILLLDYIVLLVYCALDSARRGIYLATIYLWKGRKQMERERDAKRAIENPKDEDEDIYVGDYHYDSDSEYDYFEASARLEERNATRKLDVVRSSIDSGLSRMAEQKTASDLPYFWARPIRIMRLEHIKKLSKKVDDAENNGAARTENGRKSASIRSGGGSKSTKSNRSKSSIGPKISKSVSMKDAGPSSAKETAIETSEAAKQC